MPFVSFRLFRAVCMKCKDFSHFKECIQFRFLKKLFFLAVQGLAFIKKFLAKSFWNGRNILYSLTRQYLCNNSMYNENFKHFRIKEKIRILKVKFICQIKLIRWGMIAPPLLLLYVMEKQCISSKLWTNKSANLLKKILNKYFFLLCLYIFLHDP